MEQTTTTITQPKPILIIDTNAFIRCLDMRKFAEKYEIYTSSNVLNEIRDKNAREKFASLDIDIKTTSADDKSFNFTEDFAKRTGDFFSLSFTDKELIAIGVSLINQRGKGDQLRKQPPEMTEWIPKEGQEVEEEEEEPEEKPDDDDGFVTVTKGKVLTKDDVFSNKKNKLTSDNEKATEEKEVDQKNEQEEEVLENEQELEQDNEPELLEENEEENKNLEGIVLEKISGDQELKDNAEGQTGEKFDDDDSDEDDGKGWINPSNITKKLYKATKNQDRTQEVGLAIMTTDYAMQNVIIQMGIPLISTEGFTIKQTRRFVLECYCCHKICKNNTKQFCPACGNPTLTKLSLRVNDDGTITYFRNPKKRISARGKIYSIPKSEGGRNSKDLLLREDEFLMRGRLQKLERQEKEKDKKFKQRLQDYDNGLTFDDIRLQYKHNMNKIEIGYGKMNPNDRDQFRKKKR